MLVCIFFIPRLELCGAQLLSRLLHHVKTLFNKLFTNIFAWTDSMIVLNWLVGSPRETVAASEKYWFGLAQFDYFEIESTVTGIFVLPKKCPRTFFFLLQNSVRWDKILLLNFVLPCQLLS